MKIKRIIVFTFILTVLSTGSYFFWRYRAYIEARKQNWDAFCLDIQKEISLFNGESGIVVKDLSTGWEFSHNKELLFPAASLTKVPIMAACFLASEQGRLKLDSNIALKSRDKLAGSGVLKELPSGTNLSIQQLIGLMIYDSDNTAANILTNITGIEYLNSTFKAFGLKNTDLSRRIADYKSRSKGIENYTNAEDMALLLESMHRGALINKGISRECINVMKLTHSNDRIPRYLPDETVIAHKTGLERGVCHDAGIIFTPKGDILLVILTKYQNQNSSRSKKFIARIASLAFSHLSSK